MIVCDDEGTICPACSTVLEAPDDSCRGCGAWRADGLVGGSAYPTNDVLRAELVPIPPSPRQRITERRGLVLLLCFAVLGPLALGLLWRSAQFSRPWKIVLTILVLLQTALLIWLLWYALSEWIVQPLERYGVLDGGTSLGSLSP